MPFCDVYYASLRTANARDAPGLVVKILDIATFALNFANYEDTQAMAMRCVADNVINFDVLKPLQGIHVPRFAGLFARETVYCLVFEDAGHSVPWSKKCDQEVK